MQLSDELFFFIQHCHSGRSGVVYTKCPPFTSGLQVAMSDTNVTSS